MPLKITKSTSLKVKLAIFTAISTALMFLFLVIYVGSSQRSAAYTDSKSLALEVSRKASLETEKFFSTAFEVTRELSRNFEVLKNNKVERKVLNEILKKTLEKNSDFLATWFVWEPNAYDNKNREYANNKDYDSTGNFLCTYFRPNIDILSEKNDIVDFTADYYTVPKAKRSEVLMDPYEYEYRGYKGFFYETSVVVPLIYNNMFNGVVAVDINLKKLKDKLNSINIYKTGYVSLISNSGIIVNHPDNNFIKKNIKNLLKTSKSSRFDSIFTNSDKSYETISEFTGKKVLRIIYPIDIGETNTPWYTLVEIPLSEITDRSDQLLYTSIFILLIGLSLLLYLIINILERRKYEKVLIDAKLKAQESEKIKNAFLGNISHEIRTPMNGIMGFTELYANAENTQDQIHAYRGLIRNACNQLLFIINDMLDMAAIETGKVAIKMSSVSLEYVVKNLRTFFESQAMEKNILLSFSLTDECKISIETDELKLVQILTNLINNGIKFTDEGTVEVRCSIIANNVVFSISDSGIGINPENQDLVFERFRQVDNTLNRRYQGVGLGLSISKAFTELLGGKIWFEPNLSKGTTFHLSLPLKLVKT